MNEQVTPNDIQLKLRYRISGRMPSVFAQSILVQGLPEAVVLSFFETILPPLPELTTEDLEMLRETGLVAECVGRVTMSPQAFLEAADVMQRVAATIREAMEKGGTSSNA